MTYYELYTLGEGVKIVSSCPPETISVPTTKLITSIVVSEEPAKHLLMYSIYYDHAKIIKFIVPIEIIVNAIDLKLVEFNLFLHYINKHASKADIKQLESDLRVLYGKPAGKGGAIQSLYSGSGDSVIYGNKIQNTMQGIYIHGNQGVVHAIPADNGLLPMLIFNFEEGGPPAVSGFSREIVAALPNINQNAKSPCDCNFGFSPNVTIMDVIVHLNDNDHWSREQIADWLDTLDIDLSFSGGENEDKDNS